MKRFLVALALAAFALVDAAPAIAQTNVQNTCAPVWSATLTTTTNGSEFENRSYRGARFLLDVTAASGTSPSLTVKFQAYDSVTDKWIDVPGAAFTAKTAVSTDDLTIYPGIAATANEKVSDVLPFKWRPVCYAI
jgi:hypothetical protein